MILIEQSFISEFNYSARTSERIMDQIIIGLLYGFNGWPIIEILLFL